MCVQFIVLAVAVVAVSAGIYPAKTGGKGAGHIKGGSDSGDKLQDDRFHLQSPDGQYVFGHATGSQVRKMTLLILCTQKVQNILKIADFE